MRGKLIFGLLIFCLVGVLFVKPSFAWLSGWGCRQDIFLSNIAGDLTNYQVRIDLNSTNVGSNFNWSNNGSDIRFTNSTDDELNFWIESWNSAEQEATIWVNVTSLPNNTNTTIYMYYCNSTVSSASDVASTFIRVIDNLRSSWHFDEGSGTTTSDDSGSGYTGTINGASWVSGKYGQALDYENSEYDYVSVPDYQRTTPERTVVAWVKKEGEYSSAGMIFGTDDGSSGNAERSGQFKITDVSGTDTLYVYIHATTSSGCYNSSVSIGNNWTFLAMTYDTHDVVLYQDGSIIINCSSPEGAINPGTGMAFGRISDEKSSEYFDGIIDEVFDFNDSLSSEEIQDLYNNYGYTTENYPNKVLVKKYADPEPTASFGSEEYCVEITINDPKNQTYYTTSIPVNISTHHPASENYQCNITEDGNLIGETNQSSETFTTTLNKTGGSHNVSCFCVDANGQNSSDSVNYYVWMGLNISVYYDNGTEAINWNISITNGTNTTTGTYNNSAMLEWNEIPYGEINITVDDGSDTLYYYQNTTNTTNNETNYQELNFTLTAKGNNTLTLTATPSWSIIETQQVQITCIAEEGTPHLYMDNTEISNPYTGQPTTGTYTITCNVSETANYRPITENNTLIVNPLISCTTNNTFAFSTEITTTTNITSLNFTKFVNQHYVKDDLSDVYIPNVSNVWKNTTNGYYIVVNNTNLSSFTAYFGNYYAYRNYTNHAVSNIQNITSYQQENIYAVFRFLDEVTGEEFYPPDTSEVLVYISCAQGSNYITIEENDSQFLIAFTSYPTKVLTRVQYSVENYYSRSLYPAQADQYLLSFYLIDAYKYYADKINFVILSSDYYDAKLQIYKQISNQTIIITEGYFDQMRTFPAYLLEDHDYYFRLINGDEIRDIGTFTVTSAGTQYLDVSQVILSPSVSLFADKVTIGAEYNNTTDTIRIQYKDLTEKTINITISVYNNTGIYFQQTYNSSNFTITLNDVPKNQSWYVRYVLYHEIYGNSPITGSISLISGVLVPLMIASWLYPLVSFFILFLTSSIITPRNIIGGMLSIFVLMYLLYYIGWLSLTADAIVVISIILIMGILLHIRSRGEAL